MDQKVLLLRVQLDYKPKKLIQVFWIYTILHLNIVCIGFFLWGGSSKKIPLLNNRKTWHWGESENYIFNEILFRVLTKLLFWTIETVYGTIFRLVQWLKKSRECFEGNKRTRPLTSVYGENGDIARIAQKKPSNPNQYLINQRAW